MRFLIAIQLSMVLSLPLLAQTKTLRPNDPVKLDFRLGSNDFPSNDIMCDRSGNTYVTVSDPTSDDRSDRPLLKFDKSGALQAEFSTSRKSLGFSEYEDHFEPSTPLPNGGIARIAWGRPGMYLVRFAEDGKLESRVKLEGPPVPTILPYQVAAFASGEILLSGLENCRSVRCLGAFKSFTALYSPSGDLIKRLSIPRDDEIDAAAEIGDSRYAAGPMFGNRAVSGGRMRLGDDGNVYLMRHTSPAAVYVISSSGDLARTLQIQPPRDGWASVDMQVSGEKIAIEFSDCSSRRCEGSTLTVADAKSGKRLTDYSDDNLGTLACFAAESERLTFLTVSEKNALQLVVARAK